MLTIPKKMINLLKDNNKHNWIIDLFGIEFTNFNDYSFRSEIKVSNFVYLSVALK